MTAKVAELRLGAVRATAHLPLEGVHALRAAGAVVLREVPARRIRKASDSAFWGPQNGNLSWHSKTLVRKVQNATYVYSRSLKHQKKHSWENLRNSVNEFKMLVK